MGIEKINSLESKKKKSDYAVSKALMENLEYFGEESIDWGNDKKYPNRFAYDLIENGDREIVLNHIENFSKTEQLAVRLINAANVEDRSKIGVILGKFSGLSKKLALSLISSKYQCEEEVILYKDSFKGLDYEVARRLAMKGVLHDELGIFIVSRNDFVGIRENQRQDLIKLSKDRYASNEKFKRDITEETSRERDELRRENRD